MKPSTTNNGIPLCRDCIHCQVEGQNWEDAICMRLAIKAMDMVSGEAKMVSNQWCLNQRQLAAPTACGPIGQFFKAKAVNAPKKKGVDRR